MDTCYNCCEPSKGWFSTDERKWINKIRKLKEAYPAEVAITQEPETNDGCLVCIIPPDWFKISPPKKVNLTEEQRRQKAELLAAVRSQNSSRKTN